MFETWLTNHVMNNHKECIVKLNRKQIILEEQLAEIDKKFWEIMDELIVLKDKNAIDDKLLKIRTLINSIESSNFDIDCKYRHFTALKL